MKLRDDDYDASVPLIDVDSGRRIAKTTIAVEGMTCGACTAAIEGAFSVCGGAKLETWERN
jgi:hypothetical protein